MKIIVGLNPQKTALTLSFDYSQTLITRLKNRVYGRMFDSELGCWIVPFPSFDDLVKEFGAMLELAVPYKEIIEAMDNCKTITGTVDMQAVNVLKLKPYDYQIIGGTAFLPYVKCGILADPPGLGKTIQTFLGFASLYERGLAQKCLVFCKASLKSQWLSELEKFTPYKGIIIKGTPEQRARLYEEASKPAYQFIIVNYDFLIHDTKYVRKRNEKGYNGFNDCENLAMLMKQSQVLVMDEAQKLKNDSSQIHKNMFKLVYGTKAYPVEPPEYRWLLTGTPIENEPEDIYNLFKFINQAILGYNPMVFKSRYYEGRYHDKVRKNMLKDLSARIAPYMLRRLQESVNKSFPRVRIDTILLDMTDEQTKLHDILKDITKDLINGVKHPELNGDDYSPIGIFSLLLRVADNPQLLFTSNSELAKKLARKYLKESDKPYPKLEWIRDYLDARKQFEPNAKTIIFTRSDDMALLAQKELLSIYEPDDIILFLGGMSDKQRDLAKAKFWADGKVFISTDAGAEGLNLQCADTEINIDLPPIPSRLTQRIGRIKRDQSEFSHIRVINLISKDSIDERILEIIYKKQDIIDSVIEGNVVEDAKITESVLLQLLA